MALSDIADMTNSNSLRNRLVAGAAQQGKDQKWANENQYALCATQGWDAAWASGKQGGVNVNPDTGVRTDVISDDMIAEAITALIDAEQAAAEQETAQ
ncbi:hypothetical protein [Nocardioides nematodiphilus]|uniref:hypothetical protein n=1 Tax=Nocardioides nematodiphilus TaxID=2849669 RepID=UPI001CDA1F39|nr:hypothetical protein [Nocardioides nematodiphilus]MCA1984788.1 hypothetical protein [Nocardioides nematodiphilus]